MAVTAAANQPNTIPALLKRNPKIRDEHLAGTIGANIIGFQGTVKVETKTHSFAVGNKLARFIYITPFGNVHDFFVYIKRALVGVDFPIAVENNGIHITEYVLGLLRVDSPQYAQAKREAETAFGQGRYFTVIIAEDASALTVELESSRGSPCIVL